MKTPMYEFQPEKDVDDDTGEQDGPDDFDRADVEWDRRKDEKAERDR